MLSLSSLLNPAPPGPSITNRFPPSPALSSPTDSCVEDSSFHDRLSVPKHKMPKDAAVFTKSKPKGVVNFPPFERLDETSLRLVRKFQVYPFGKIQEYSRHIPYNSGKKDFYEKTGRESFEVFQYIFKVPGNEAEYAVMWDYNVGLVRMTPFFKCCKYPKTTPAKMLNSNPGLKEITHSITGGSIMAQGYWMPYQCAKAVCATFCYNIAGALIPIFGPDFPSLCTPAEAPEYSRMIIDPAIVMGSAREAEHYRRLYSNAVPSGLGSKREAGNQSPKHDRDIFRDHYDESNLRHNPRYRVARKTFVTTAEGEEAMYRAERDRTVSPVVERGGLSREPHRHPLQRHLYSPMPSTIAPLRPTPSVGSSHGWTPANVLHQYQAHPHTHPHPHPHPHTQYQNPGPSPWLSAIPRFTTTAHLPAISNTHQRPHHHSYSTGSSTGHVHQHPSNPHTYHQTTIRSQLPSPSDAPQHPFSSSNSSPRGKRPAAQIADDPPDRHRHPHTVPTPRMHTQSHHRHSEIHTHPARHPLRDKPKDLGIRRCREEESLYVSASGSGSGARNEGNGNAGGIGADKKAALLLMNLSVRDSQAKNVDESSTTDATSARMYATEGLAALRPDLSASGGDNSGRGGLASETSTPLEGMFPRIKRVRSNSM
ncbi:hypothetical protein F5Y16DRAFT_414842 [Xylariaceae sp. FL0255]|nr:hypothetical protein F5Y16DRAFT_414842 [Xylariaceae sp. FL0255]